MKAIVLTGLAAALLWTAPAAAHPGYDYVGGCGFATLSDGGESAETTWTGQLHAVVVATDGAGTPSPATPITIDCVVYVNHADPVTVLSASGTGVAANATPWSYQAAPEDIVTVCDVVAVGGERHEDCADATTTPLLPQEVVDLLTQVFETLDWIGWLLWDPEPGPCNEMAVAAPGVPGVVDVTPEGDVYIVGEFFWDCPPYAT